MLQALKEFDLYDDTHRLRITVSNMKNGNSRKKLEEIKTSVLKALSNIAAAPGAQFAPVPPRHQIVSTLLLAVILALLLHFELVISGIMGKSSFRSELTKPRTCVLSTQLRATAVSEEMH